MFTSRIALNSPNPFFRLNHIDTSQRLRPAARIRSLTVTTMSVGVTADGVIGCAGGVSVSALAA